MDSFSRESLLSSCGIEASRTRGKSRDSLFLQAAVRIGSEPATRDVRVRNLSEGGMMAELDRVVPTGTPISATLRGLGEVTGTVAWCAEHRIGIAFDTPIDPKRARKPVGSGTKTPAYAKSTI